MNEVCATIDEILGGAWEPRAARDYPETLDRLELVGNFRPLLQSMLGRDDFGEYELSVLKALESLPFEQYAELLIASYDAGSLPGGSWRTIVVSRAIGSDACAAWFEKLIRKNGTNRHPHFVAALRELASDLEMPEVSERARSFVERLER